MPHAQRHRGPHPDDSRLFREATIPLLRAAAVELHYLQSRGYPLDPALAFVGGHHQLESRQRMALRRTAGSAAQLQARAARLVPIAQAAEAPLYIDGFNLLITLEVAVSGGLLLRGSDGALRDLAGLSGTYHPVEETEAALRIFGEALHALKVPAVTLFLDAPMSNSGRLRARVLEHAAAWAMPVQVELVPDADRTLVGATRVVSSDAAVLDSCASWVNLGSWLVQRALPAAWVIDLGVSEPAKSAALVR